ncbi:peptide deformylase [Shewanella sp. FYR11-62]|uniref:Peptide deformylase n=2 Tax=Shewanella subflava TaxID=2986476 RepID=A0ABT3IAU3_9GAMM|nr:peptide deformylase [Shewanella subflava]MCW3173164.1 peptide deformylase [Shewanella subflava]
MSNSAVLPIATVGEKILAQHAQAVIEFDHSIQLLAENMLTTMIAANGVGIAAPQVFSSVAMFIMASRPNPRYPDAPNMSPVVVINPHIIERSTLMELAEEGCLSIPGQRIKIWRHAQIKVQYHDLNGNLISNTLVGFIARIFQHEFDHIQGITLLERSKMPEQQRPDTVN